MSNSDQPSSSSQPGRPRRGALERLYVYWLLSTLVLLLVVIGTGIFFRSALDRQANSSRDLSARVADLEGDVQDLRSVPGRRETTRPPTPTEPNAPPVSPPAAAAPEKKPPAASTAMSAPADEPAMTDAVVQSRLNEMVGAEPATPDDIRDREAAGVLLAEVVRDAGRVQWSGSTWSRLAVLARLVGHAGAERVCVARARTAGETLLAHAEVVVRELLAKDRAHEALPAATNLMRQSGGTSVARVLLAAASLASDSPGAAAEALADVPDAAHLGVYDRLLLARAWMALEAWERLEAALRTIHEVPEWLRAQRDFLVAASLARQGRTVEALAILDALLDSATVPEGGKRTETDTTTWSWARSGPSRYEIEVWRGISLALARKVDAARETLRAAAELDPGRPEAEYQLGLLEARAGRPEIATAHLKNAVAASERFAPAWEAWAALEMDAGQINPALEHLGRAVTLNPRRASAHFLTAIAYAKLSRETQAAAALRNAFQLDPRYLAEAKQTEVLLRLYTSAEMDALAAGPAGDSQPARPGDGAVPGEPSESGDRKPETGDGGSGN